METKEIDEVKLFNECMEYLQSHWTYGEVEHHNDVEIKTFCNIKTKYLLYCKQRKGKTNILLDELWEYIEPFERGLKYKNTQEPVNWDKEVLKLEKSLQ